MKAPLYWKILIMYERNNAPIKVQVCDKCIYRAKKNWEKKLSERGKWGKRERERKRKKEESENCVIKDKILRQTLSVYSR